MRVAPLADVKAHLSAYLEDVGKNGPIVITKNGRVAGVILVPESDDDLEDILITYSRRFQAMLEKSRKSARTGKTVPHDEFWAAATKRNANKA